MVDVISSNDVWLTPALSAMELQMIIQPVWDNDSYLKQLPHFTQEVIDNIAKDAPEVESILDLLEMDDDKRERLLKMDKSQLADVAKAANRYPNIDLHFEINTKVIKAGSPMVVSVQLDREMDEDERLGPVYAPFYPTEKAEGWWLVVGNTKTNQLLAIKRINFTKPQLSASLEFEAPSAGQHKCLLYFMSDSYLGCDQEWPLEFNVENESEVKS